ncbi:unnamed protein product [Dibothriocephalus latus]|uniref:Uncharacterized protein n=1 Tax=Dibothriocephalus latus TaxID=60516 RepID=A0A3P7LWG4_DIBLA|nr:unnamed protein product [Dibothriocephalus latus]
MTETQAQKPSTSECAVLETGKEINKSSSPVCQVTSETPSIVINARENLSSLTSADEHSRISYKDEQQYMKDLADDGFNSEDEEEEDIKEGSTSILDRARGIEEMSAKPRNIDTSSWTVTDPTHPREVQYEVLNEDDEDEEAEMLRRRVAELNAALALEPPIERVRPPQASRVAFKESLVDFEVSLSPDEQQSETGECASPPCSPVPVSVSTAEPMKLEERSMEKSAMKFAKVQSVCSSEAPSLGPPEIVTRTQPVRPEGSSRKRSSTRNGRGETVSEKGNTKDAVTSASISVSILKKGGRCIYFVLMVSYANTNFRPPGINEVFRLLDVGRTKRITQSGDVARHTERPLPVPPKVKPVSSSLSLQKTKPARFSPKTPVEKRKQQEEELEKARLMAEERRRLNDKVMQVRLQHRFESRQLYQ